MDLHPRYSDGSDGSEPLNGFPPRSPTPTSSQTPPGGDNYSMQDGHLTMHDRPRRSHHDKGRNSTNREFMKLLVSEELEAKQTRKFLRSALARLDGETLRAQEAERRALELAERFKLVNDERMKAQQELQRVNEELRLYKVQYDNAQREILRGQEILKDVELQRDDAEAAAARARTTARRLKEQQLVLKAREEGRKAGYQEGLRRGMVQARMERTRTEDDDTNEPDLPPLNDGTISLQDDGTATLDSRADPLGDLPVRNFTSPAPTIPLESPTPQRRMDTSALQTGEPPPSRFHEHGIGISPAPTNATLASMNARYDQPIRPVSVNNRPLSPHHPEMHIPPEGWVPEMGEDNRIHLPPPHEMQRPQSPASPTPVPIPPPSSMRQPEPPQFVSRDYAHHKPSTPSIDSIPTSISTSVSQFDLVNSPRQMHRNLSNNDRKLSTIHEVASASDFTPRHSPSVSKQPSFDARSPPAHRYERPSEGFDAPRTAMPEAIVFPGVPQMSERPQESAAASYSPRSRTQSQILSDSLRYGHPDVAAELRRSASEMRSNPSMGSMRSRVKTPSRLTTPAPLGGPLPPPTVAPQDYLRPSPTAGSTTLAPSSAGGPRRSRSAMSQRSDGSSRYAPSSSQEISIHIEPASGTPSSVFSPQHQALDMLSPSASVIELPPQQHQPVAPTVPNSPEMGRFQSMGNILDPAGGASTHKVNSLPPGFIPSAPPSPAPQPDIVLRPPTEPSISRSGTPMNNIYGQPLPMAVPEVQRSVSSGSSVPSGYPKVMHSRSRSAGQASVDSLPLRSKTPVARPQSRSSSSGGPSIYQAAPVPPGVTYPAAPGPPIAVPNRADTNTPQSTTSKMSGHARSRSMYAGITPATPSRPLSTAPAPKLRRMPSDTSMDSAVSGFSKSSRKEYAHYEPETYVDPAFLASSEELPLPFSPNTQLNTRANAQLGGLPLGNRSSDALSYVSSHRNGY